MLWSTEWRTNISLKAKDRFTNPEYKQAHIDRHKIVMAKPEVKEKIRQAAIKRFSSEDARNLARQLTIKHFSNPQMRELARSKALARFDTPEKRSKHAQSKALRCINNGMVFGSTTLAAEWVTSWRGTKADNSQIAKACRGFIAQAYNLRWEYITQAKEVLTGPRAG